MTPFRGPNIPGLRQLAESTHLLLLRHHTAQGKIVRQETSNIDAQYERKRKQTEIQKKMYVCLAYGSLAGSLECWLHQFDPPTSWGMTALRSLIVNHHPLSSPSSPQHHLEPEQQG